MNEWSYTLTPPKRIHEIVLVEKLVKNHETKPHGSRGVTVRGYESWGSRSKPLYLHGNSLQYPLGWGLAGPQNRPVSTGTSCGPRNIVCSTFTNRRRVQLRGLSPRANYIDRVTASCRQSDSQFLVIEDVTWSVWWIPTAVFSPF
jgi:hypothetical protein